MLADILSFASLFYQSHISMFDYVSYLFKWPRVALGTIYLLCHLNRSSEGIKPIS
jgi:hypothetical protein